MLLGSDHRPSLATFHYYFQVFFKSGIAKVFAYSEGPFPSGSVVSLTTRPAVDHALPRVHPSRAEAPPTIYCISRKNPRTPRVGNHEYSSLQNPLMKPFPYVDRFFICCKPPFCKYERRRPSGLCLAKRIFCLLRPGKERKRDDTRAQRTNTVCCLPIAQSTPRIAAEIWAQSALWDSTLGLSCFLSFQFEVRSECLSSLSRHEGAYGQGGVLWLCGRRCDYGCCSSTKTSIGGEHSA